ncbi:MAG: DNA-directed RNA polymerase subunit omega [Fusicatenibacter sp.]|nr:DNA-directed RNA polymerase subunit omega [Fusicatenibacter sp.]
MIHPSYQELIATINEGQDMDEAPVVSSRYSLVLATSKRARQLIAGAEPLVKVKKGMKPLSVAVEEMYKGEVTILPDDVQQEEETAE